jgi:uncharacterized protein
MHRSLKILVCLLVATVLLGTWSAVVVGQPAAKTFMVPMSDGVKLATDVYWPSDGKEPWATVLVRTPYNKDAVRGMVGNLTSVGYAVVVQDMRGRFASEGKHAIIFGNDGLGDHRDGHDTMNWVTGQKWSNGKILTWGGSAVGIVQNQAAPNAPDSLKGMAVQVAFSSYYHQAAYQGGVWRKALLEGWLRGTGMVEGNEETFKAHPYYDEFWKRIDAERFADKVNAPGVYSGGWYDIFLQGTINSFVTIQNEGGPGARGRNFLVIAPIAHGQFNQLKYPANSMQAPVNLVAPMDVFGAWLDGRQPSHKPVHYYVMGDPEVPGAPGNLWRSEDTWPPPADITPFYLHADGSLGRHKPVSNDTRSYKYDPANPVPTIGGQNLNLPKGPMDQRSIESRGDVLVFTTDVLTEPVEVTGRLYAKLYISSDCPDTDFTVKLTDVYPDGRSMLLTDGIRRASLRNTYEKPEFLESGKVYEVEVDLWSTSIIFNKGHRIRVAVSSSNSPRFEPNPNTGDPHPVDGKLRVANNTVHLSKDHPSHILLPLYRK